MSGQQVTGAQFPLVNQRLTSGVGELPLLRGAGDHPAVKELAKAFDETFLRRAASERVQIP